jgi:hypothetical protein
VTCVQLNLIKTHGTEEDVFRRHGEIEREWKHYVKTGTLLRQLQRTKEIRMMEWNGQRE